MNAPLEVKISAQTKTRHPDELWKETTTLTESFVLETDLESYTEDLEPILAQVWNYVDHLRLNLQTQVGLHYSLTIENVTAPTPSKGSILQPKQHFDGALSDGDFRTVDDLRQRLLTAIQTIRTIARY